MENDDLFPLVQELDIKLEMAKREMQKGILNFNANMVALMQILGLTVDQILDHHNLTKKLYEKYIEEYNSKEEFPLS